MAVYWSSFTSSVLGVGADIVTDMIPIVGLIAGLLLAERLVHLLLSVARR